ncbi:50S ribosomal protein L24 [Candidatus Woesearchaeota archaeon]|nr:50S ribosomal protein L24 [Candidatus Woesearchaeota archaeon]
MKSAFSPAWKASTQARKQRKYRYNAPRHIQAGFLSAHLDKALREKHGRRSMRVRKGDRVKVLRGSFRGKDGKVDHVDVGRNAVYIEKLERSKKDGTKRLVPFNASNLMIVDLTLEDKKRKRILERTAPKRKPASGEKKNG